MGAALLAVLPPRFVAGAIGCVIFVGFSTWGGLHAPSLVVPNLPPYNGTHVCDLIVAVVVGVAVSSPSRPARGHLGRLTMKAVDRRGAAATRFDSETAFD
jgi:hypothetical protein